MHLIIGKNKKQSVGLESAVRCSTGEKRQNHVPMVGRILPAIVIMAKPRTKKVNMCCNPWIPSPEYYFPPRVIVYRNWIASECQPNKHLTTNNNPKQPITTHALTNVYLNFITLRYWNIAIKTTKTELRRTWPTWRRSHAWNSARPGRSRSSNWRRNLQRSTYGGFNTPQSLQKKSNETCWNQVNRLLVYSYVWIWVGNTPP
jgi:hypothetical protein